MSVPISNLSWMPPDKHPDPLVESLEYPRPCPGWWALRAWCEISRAACIQIPMHLRVDVITDAADTTSVHMVTQMPGTFQHPSKEYIHEVVRQLLSGERMTYLSAVDAAQWVCAVPDYVEICRWGDDQRDWFHGGVGLTAESWSVWQWSAGTPVPLPLGEGEPLKHQLPHDILNAAWCPAPFTGPFLSDPAPGHDKDLT